MKLTDAPTNRHDFSYGPEDTAADVVKNMRHLRPAFELRQKWHYNNLVKCLFNAF